MAIFTKYLIASSVFSAVALAAPLVRRDVVTDVVVETVWTTVAVTTTVYDSAVPATIAKAAVTSVESPASTPTTTPASAIAAAVTTPAAAASTWASTSSAIVSTAAVAAEPRSSTAGSTSGTCEGSANGCVGDVTHWDGGLGACGTDVDSNSDYAIALPVGFMGSLSNSNPYCGRSVTLYNPTSGTTVQATVKDKCMGCVDRAIDCTNVLFTKITDGKGDGRMSGIQWWLN